MLFRSDGLVNLHFSPSEGRGPGSPQKRPLVVSRSVPSSNRDTAKIPVPCHHCHRYGHRNRDRRYWEWLDPRGDAEMRRCGDAVTACLVGLSRVPGSVRQSWQRKRGLRSPCACRLLQTFRHSRLTLLPAAAYDPRLSGMRKPGLPGTHTSWRSPRAGWAHEIGRASCRERV